MKIRILRKHIKAGKPGKCNTCPIALAIKEQTGRSRISVSASMVGTGTRGKLFALPMEAVKFIATFDYRGASGVSPFSFELPITKSRARVDRRAAK